MREGAQRFDNREQTFDATLSTLPTFVFCKLQSRMENLFDKLISPETRRPMRGRSYNLGYNDLKCPDVYSRMSLFRLGLRIRVTCELRMPSNKSFVRRAYQEVSVARPLSSSVRSTFHNRLVARRRTNQRCAVATLRRRPPHPTAAAVAEIEAPRQRFLTVLPIDNECRPTLHPIHPILPIQGTAKNARMLQLQSLRLCLKKTTVGSSWPAYNCTRTLTASAGPQAT